MRHTIRIVTGLALALVFIEPLHSAGLVTGRYEFRVPYSPVCLNGTFPMTVGDMKSGCVVTLRMDGNGALTGTLDLRTLKGPATGSLNLQGNVLSLHLQTSGMDVSQTPSQVDARLHGDRFTGTAVTSQGTVPCTLDVSLTAPLTVTFDLTLTVDGQGQVTGTGTASSCSVNIPVNVTGASSSTVCSLHVTAPGLDNFTWDGTGNTTYTGFVAEWSAHGFGVTQSGGGTTVELKAAVPALVGNISTRLSAQTGDNVLIGGFIVTGTQAKKAIIRAIGPSLPLAGKLANPQLELHDSSGKIIALNDDWKDAANKQAIIDSTVAPTNDKESAILASLSPGAYTAIVSGVGNTTGVGLVEVYDLDLTADSRLANISTRGFVQAGDNVLIGGFIVLGNEAQRVVVRAIGPSLPLSNALTDPILDLHDPNGGVLATNDDWVAGDALGILATHVAPTNNKESAIVATIIPGPYTAIVRGANGATGVAVVEVYGLQP